MNSVFQIVGLLAARLRLPRPSSRSWLGLEQEAVDVSDLGDRQVGADLPRDPAAGRVPDPA
ncbi:MAG: hypothetical protein U5R31_08650 [Acidimicrobiia bacterium]|nr:hypothetical protein [Acidimicrobiia bacterium]